MEKVEGSEKVTHHSDGSVTYEFEVATDWVAFERLVRKLELEDVVSAARATLGTPVKRQVSVDDCYQAAKRSKFPHVQDYEPRTPIQDAIERAYLKKKWCGQDE